MRAMLAAFVAIIVLSIGAGYALNMIGPASGTFSDAARVTD
ncbi:MAG: hypothetical protein AAF367_03895 [Pseudomonadota bacterium]